jgi:hypothetical protein
VPGRPISLRAVREALFNTLQLACGSWRLTYSGRAPLNEDAENAFLRVVIAWESFLSDWLMSAVVRDPSALGAKFQAELEEWTARKYGLTVQQHHGASLTALKTSLHFSSPSYEEVRQLMDPRGRNIEFDGLREFRGRAEAMVGPTYAVRARSALPQRGRPTDGVVEAATSIRNWLAHRSQYSRSVMQSRLAALANTELTAASFPTSAGSYLKHWLPGPHVTLPEFTRAAQAPGSHAAATPHERRRFLLYVSEYVRIAWRLVPIEDT